MTVFRDYLIFGFILIALSLTGYGMAVAFQGFISDNKHDTLPYSRPHLDWFREEDSKRCVGWIFVDMGAYFIICDREPPIIAPIHDAHRMLPKTEDSGLTS